MGDGLYVRRRKGGQHGFYIDFGRPQQSFAQCAAQFAVVAVHNLLVVEEHFGHGDRQPHGRAHQRVLSRAIHFANAKDLAHQGEAVGVYARGLYPDEHVPRGQATAVDDLLPVHHAYGKPGQIVVVLGHHARVLGGLPADEGAARLHAALGHAGDNGGDFLREVFAAGNVVQKEQGLCAAANHIVDAHGHRVNADGVVLVQQHGDFQLGAHPVRAGDQNGLLHPGKIRSEQPAKASNAGHDSGDDGAGHMFFHQFHRLIACGYVHPGGLVAVAEAFQALLPRGGQILAFLTHSNTLPVFTAPSFPGGKWGPLFHLGCTRSRPAPRSQS